MHQPYISIIETSYDYMDILKEKSILVDNLEEADIVIIHYDMRYIELLLRDIPALNKKYIIGYMVWEATTIPSIFQEKIKSLNEIWTASSYSYEIFKKYHPEVIWVPHIVKNSSPAGQQSLDELSKIIDTNKHFFNYLTITKKNELRKNTNQLIDAFKSIHTYIPNSRLIIKVANLIKKEQDHIDINHEGPITMISGYLPKELLRALYHISQVYISAHHSEGWGLNISDAMSMGVPVIVTGYSGNMDFTTKNNALLIDYAEKNIKDKDIYYIFNKNMMWAYPYTESIENKILCAYKKYQDGTIHEKIKLAKDNISIYNRDNISKTILNRLDTIHYKITTGDPHGKINQ